MSRLALIAITVTAFSCAGTGASLSTAPAKGAPEPGDPEAVTSDAIPAATVDIVPCKGERVLWNPGDDLSGVPEGSTVLEKNITGDKELELFVRGPCPQGKPCEFFLYAACGNRTFAKLEGAKLFGDGIETSRQGALFGRVYWLDVIIKKVEIVVDNMSEGRYRFRFDGKGYQPVAE